MAYSESKDKLIKLFEYGDEENGALHFSLFSYDEGPPKLQITRMFKKKDGTHGYGKSGRLTKEELIYLKDNIDKIIEIMESN